ncbi:MAG: DNA-3-methyladenine glycosylase 2 family protein [Anaerolineales bacterium]|nr:DNA-3-methyladenine glycosylase 2 family protein [Anaerolineales bacterium]
MLTETELLRGVRALSRRDPDLRRIAKTYGPPPLWEREPGFVTLVYLILEQQVSLASARAAFNRLRTACRGQVTPRRVLKFTDAEMKAFGFSRQKMLYARELAQAILAKQFVPESLSEMSDADAHAELVKLKGIGRWTADNYLLMCLLRPDVWPHGDLALAVAVQKAKGLPARPSYDELTAMAEQWKPWRAVAARLFWHYYLSERKKPAA